VDLFSQHADTPAHELIQLPDAELLLVRHYFSLAHAQDLFVQLRDNTPWKQDQLNMFGKRVPQPRLTAAYSEPHVRYRYSGLQMQSLAWTPALLELKLIIEELSGQSFNHLLMNYYRDGQDSMGWHSDDETELGINPVVASISLGHPRSLKLKHKQRRDLTTLQLPLGDGDILIMRGTTQAFWEHSISKQTQGVGPRINLSFRQIIS
jgi:alkylated DNA repair dioxygenase AlkB